MRDKFKRRLWMTGISAVALAMAGQASAAVLNGQVRDASGVGAQGRAHAYDYDYDYYNYYYYERCSTR